MTNTKFALTRPSLTKTKQPIEDVSHDETYFEEEIDNPNMKIDNLNIDQDKVNPNVVETFSDDDTIIDMNDGHSSEEEINEQVEATLKEVNSDEATHDETIETKLAKQRLEHKHKKEKKKCKKQKKRRNILEVPILKIRMEE